MNAVTESPAEILPLTRPVVAASLAWRVLWQGLCAGIALFLIQNLAVWTAWLAAPNGTQPLFHIQTNDANQYLGFLALARNHALFPDLHAPWLTTPAMLNPIFLTGGMLAAWLGVSPIVALNMLELVLYLAAASAFSWTLHVLLPTRTHRLAAVAATLCAMPITMFALGIARWFAPTIASLFWLGTIELTYTSADGLLRGGLSNSPTISFGTTCVLLALGCVGMRLQTGNRRWTLALAATVLISAFVHPFEVFVIAPAAMVSLVVLDRAYKCAAAVALAATLGLTPYVLLSAQHAWFRELSQTFTFDGDFGRFILAYGVAFLAIPYLLLMGARPRDITDKMVAIAWVLTIVISLTPGAPFPPHLLDGFAPLTGILIVRLAMQPKFTAIYAAHRRPVQIALTAILGLTGIAYAGAYLQIARDATQQSSYLLPAVAGQDEVALVNEMRHRAAEQDLAIAPDPLAMMLIAVPMHSLASHEHLSFSYAAQQGSAQNFYAGKMSAAEATSFITNYGAQWIVVPTTSPALAYFKDRPEEFREGRYLVYRLRENHLRPYPGIAQILPPDQRHTPLSERVFQLLGR